jgi:hypothetical protein
MQEQRHGVCQIACCHANPKLSVDAYISDKLRQKFYCDTYDSYYIMCQTYLSIKVLSSDSHFWPAGLFSVRTINGLSHFVTVVLCV